MMKLFVKYGFYLSSFCFEFFEIFYFVLKEKKIFCLCFIVILNISLENFHFYAMICYQISEFLNELSNVMAMRNLSGKIFRPSLIFCQVDFIFFWVLKNWIKLCFGAFNDASAGRWVAPQWHNPVDDWNRSAHILHFSEISLN